MSNILDHYFYIQGAYALIHVYADQVEEPALQQLHYISNCPAFAGSKIAIMPDVHAGKGAVIGFTATITDKVSPNIVGVDIGCGVSAYNLGSKKPNFIKLDEFIIDHIPRGHCVNANYNYGNTGFEGDLALDTRDVAHIIGTFDSADYYDKSIGTLGGGNHFIEVDYSVQNDSYWLVIHSGSRKFGNDIGNYYWKLAKSLGNYTNGKKELAWLDGTNKEDYLHAAKVAQHYAAANRQAMAETILTYLNYDADYTEHVESVHNYIDFTDQPIVRKGAIAARKGDRVIIPLNMAAGCILGVGKGNSDWNMSAPHGAGRKLSRSGAKRELNMVDFEKSMEGVWSSCIGPETLDEAPDAYKDVAPILAALPATVEITDTLKSVYVVKDAKKRGEPVCM